MPVTKSNCLIAVLGGLMMLSAGSLSAAPTASPSPAAKSKVQAKPAKPAVPAAAPAAKPAVAAKAKPQPGAPPHAVATARPAAKAPAKRPAAAAVANGKGPGGATARCKDNSYSHSASRTGTCAGHGGVAQWY